MGCKAAFSFSLVKIAQLIDKMGNIKAAALLLFSVVFKIRERVKVTTFKMRTIHYQPFAPRAIQ